MQNDTRFREAKRARRIRERDRMQARAERLCAREYGYRRPEGEERRGWERLKTWADVFAARAAKARRLRDHLAICSCAMCGNPRKYMNEMTFQERRAVISAEEQIAATTADIE